MSHSKMKMRLCSFICFLMFGVGAPSAHAACEPKSILVDKIQRNGLVCTGAKYNAAIASPLVLVFHGRGSSAAEMAAATRIHEAWPEAIVAYLDGLTGNPAPHDKQGRQPGWEINPGDMNDRDVRFVDRALDALNKRYKIDTNRVYAVGHSNGARFMGILWSMRAERFAAFAFSAAQADTLMEHAPPRSVFMSMGRRDDVVPFEWQQHSIELARQLLHTDADKALQSGNIRKERGPGDLELETYVHDGGHLWPSDQTRLIVKFLKRHRLR